MNGKHVQVAWVTRSILTFLLPFGFRKAVSSSIATPTHNNPFFLFYSNSTCLPNGPQMVRIHYIDLVYHYTAYIRISSFLPRCCTSRCDDGTGDLESQTRAAHQDGDVVGVVDIDFSTSNIPPNTPNKC